MSWADDYNLGLRDGKWVVRGGVFVWQPERRKRQPAKCGTDGGYYRHLRKTKTPPCAWCKRAHATAERERSERARKAVA